MFLTAYTKSEKANLSKAERNEIAKMIVRLEHGLKEQEGKNECIREYHAGLE
ncbi:MAG: hypothetical protein LBF60_09735 [Treponema sp.]|nr:hypothetical protein [Treponema sp.]